MRRNPLAACILQLPRKLLRRPPGVISQRKPHPFASDLPCCRRQSSSPCTPLLLSTRLARRIRLLRFSEPFCEDQPEVQTDFENEECRFLCPIPESTSQAVLPDSPRTVNPRTMKILWILQD